MKITKYMAGCVMAAALLTACSDTQTYEMPGFSTGAISFTAVNLSAGMYYDKETPGEWQWRETGDSAVSWPGFTFEGNRYLNHIDRDERLSINAREVRYEWVWNEETQQYRDSFFVTEDTHGVRTERLQYWNMLWVPGNSQIQITYHPQPGDGKEVTFTFPDGTSRVLTATDNVTVWTFEKVDPGYPWLSDYNEDYQGSGVALITAESKSQEGLTTIVNRGSVIMYMGQFKMLRYYGQKSGWIWNEYGDFDPTGK